MDIRGGWREAFWLKVLTLKRIPTTGANETIEQNIREVSNVKVCKS